MTVPATPRRAGPYDGTGAQTAFGFSFKAFDEADVRVVELDEPTNVETDAVLNSDYSVALNPDQESTPGGTVNYFVAPSSDKKITLIGDLDFAQPVDLPDGGNYRAQQVEDALDRLAICMQQLKEITDRCAQVPVSSADASALFESINILAANLPTLQTVVANIADLLTLANDIDDVALVAAISAEVQAVAAMVAQVVAVAAIAPEIVAVEGISAEVVTVATNMAAILAAVADLPALAGKANSGDVTTSLLTTDAGSIIGRVAGGGAGALQKLTPELVVALIRASTPQAIAGVSNDVVLTPALLKASQIQQGASVSLSGQTFVDFTGIPAFAKRLTLITIGMSTNGSSDPSVQLGDAGGIETTGYSGTGFNLQNSTNPLTIAVAGGFILNTAWAAGIVVNAVLFLEKGAGNTWIGVFLVGQTASAIVCGSVVAKTLSDVLTQLRFNAGGATQFDAGTAILNWE